MLTFWSSSFFCVLEELPFFAMCRAFVPGTIGVLITWVGILEAMCVKLPICLEWISQSSVFTYKILSLLRIQCHISAQLCSPHLYQPKWMTYWQIPTCPPRSCSNDTFLMQTSWTLQLQDELFLWGWLYVFIKNLLTYPSFLTHIIEQIH